MEKCDLCGAFYIERESISLFGGQIILHFCGYCKTKMDNEYKETVERNIGS